MNQDTGGVARGAQRRGGEPERRQAQRHDARTHADRFKVVLIVHGRSNLRSPMRRLLHLLVGLPRLLLVGCVRTYQRVLSPHFPSSCRYTPSCSEYAIQALDKYGAVRGSILGAHRILRCHPWGGHGYDPPRWYGEKDEVEPA